MTWKNLEPSMRLPNIREKQAALMKAFAKRSLMPGAEGRYRPDTDFPLAWAANEGEVRFLVEDLKVRELLDPSVTAGQRFLITAKGWDYIDSLSTSSVFSDQVFVAMSFSEAMRLVWENAIAPAVRRAGYTPYRVDAAPHIDRIDIKIMAEIKGSRFLIADVTEQKAGVYFEAGYAIGQGLPVFWAVREDDLKNVHFDTRQYAHIVWKDEADLEEKLYDFIIAIIGAGKR
jgi:nucleoside 2-deoxyribosyltransferase